MTEASSPAPAVSGTHWLAEVALVLVSLATIAGYVRLFDDLSFFGPIALAALVGHAFALVLRRLGVGAVIATAAGLMALPLFITCPDNDLFVMLSLRKESPPRPRFKM